MVPVLLLVVYSTDLAPLLRQLLIVRPQDADVHKTKYCARDGETEAGPKGRWVVRRFLLDEDVTGHEVCAVADAEDDGRADCDACSATEVIDEPGGGHGHLDEGASAHAKQAEVSHSGCDAVTFRIHKINDPTDQDARDAEENEGKTPASFSGDECSKDLEDHAADPDGDGHGLSRRRLPAELGQDSGDERRHTGGGHVTAEEHERGKQDLVVADDLEPVCAFDVDLLVTFVEA